MGRYGVSAAFKGLNLETTRRTVIMVGVYSPGDTSYGSRFYATWAGTGQTAAISEVSAIGSGYEVASLSYRIGEVSVSIVGQSTAPEFASIFVQSVNAPRFADVLMGFRPVGSSSISPADYLCVFRGVLRSLSFSSTVATFVISDGLDVMRRADVEKVLEDSDPFAGSPQPLDLEHPAKVCVDVVSDYLQASTNEDESKVRGWDEHPETIEQTGFFNELLEGIHSVDSRLFRHLIKTQIIKTGDPKAAIDRDLLAAFACFLRRDSFGYWALGDIHPQDKDGGLPSASVYTPRRSIGDEVIVSVGSAAYDAESMVRGVSARFGFVAWSFWSDVLKANQDESADDYIPSNVRHSGDRVGTFAFAHEFTPFSGVHPAWSGAGADGRVVSMSAFTMWPTEDDQSIDITQDASLVEPLGSRAFGYHDYFEPQDSFGFPTTFRHSGREWAYPDYRKRSVSLYDEPGVSNRFDEAHEFHKTAFRIIRAGGLPHALLPVEVLSSAGALLAVGDLVHLESTHVPNLALRELGFGGSAKRVVAQVRERTFSAIGSTVSLVLAVPMEPRKGSGFSVYDGGTPIHVSTYAERNICQYGAIQAHYHNQFSIFGDQFAAEWRLRGVDGEPKWDAHRLHGHRFHYLRYTFRVLFSSISAPSVIRVRAALMSTDEDGRQRVAFSRLFRVAGKNSGQSFTFTDSIFAPAVPGFDPEKSRVQMFKGHTSPGTNWPAFHTDPVDGTADTFTTNSDAYPGADNLTGGDIVSVHSSLGGPFAAEILRLRTRDHKGDPWSWKVDKLPRAFWERYGQLEPPEDNPDWDPDYPRTEDGGIDMNYTGPVPYSIFRPARDRMDESIPQGRPWLSPHKENMPGRSMSAIHSLKLSIEGGHFLDFNRPSGTTGPEHDDPDFHSNPSAESINVVLDRVEVWRHTFTPEEPEGPVIVPPINLPERGKG